MKKHIKMSDKVFRGGLGLFWSSNEVKMTKCCLVCIRAQAPLEEAWVRFKNKVPTPGDSTPTKPTASMYLLTRFFSSAPFGVHTYLLGSSFFSNSHSSGYLLSHIISRFFSSTLLYILIYLSICELTYSCSWVQ